MCSCWFFMLSEWTMFGCLFFSGVTDCLSRAARVGGRVASSHVTCKGPNTFCKWFRRLQQIRRRGRPLQPGGRQHTSCADTCCCCVQEVRSVTSVPHVLNTPACSKNTRVCVCGPTSIILFVALSQTSMISTSVRHPFWTSQPCPSIFKLAVPGGRHSSHINNVLV